MQKTNAPLKSCFGEDALSVWESPTHFAAAFEQGGAVRLSIGRQDLSDGMTWDELRAIKNACGYADSDAIELYPAEEAVINTGPIRHLYILPDKHPLVRRGR